MERVVASLEQLRGRIASAKSGESLRLAQEPDPLPNDIDHPVGSMVLFVSGGQSFHLVLRELKESDPRFRFYSWGPSSSLYIPRQESEAVVNVELIRAHCVPDTPANRAKYGEPS